MAKENINLQLKANYLTNTLTKWLITNIKFLKK